MGSFTAEVKDSPENIFAMIQRTIGASGFEIKSVVPNTSIIAEGKREYRLWLLILLVLIMWPLALVYFFTRPKNTISVTISPKREGEGSVVTISTSGKKADEILQMLSTSLR
ncbi:MAG: hypothetical protein DRJ98_07910 [Thermoprotei archaeon]|nr:MAG: hypothetical protein DRJ98_07910 [Thermoprotei archaeon]RLF18300.1 MAG: hypothetical protein DRN06_01860 [Thermoprotei archaeon]